MAVLLAYDNFEGRTSINPASDGGTWVIESGTWVAGSPSGGAHTASGTGEGKMVRDIGQESMDARWTLQITGSLTLESFLLFCYWEPAGVPTCIGIAYNGTGAGWCRIGDVDNGGFTTYPGATGLGVAWTGGKTVVRAVFDTSTRTLTAYQDGTVIWTGTLGYPNLTLPPEDREYGTFCGIQTRLSDYSASGEEILEFSAYSLPFPTVISTANTRASEAFFTSPANRRTMG